MVKRVGQAPTAKAVGAQARTLAEHTFPIDQPTVRSDLPR